MPAPSRSRAPAGEIAAAGRRGRWRSALAVTLLVTGCLLAPVALAGRWAAGEIADQDRYVANVAPLAARPELRAAVTDRLTDEIVAYLPLERTVRAAVGQVVASDAFARAWTEGNRLAHARLDALLSGGDRSGALVVTEDDGIGLDLGTLIGDVKRRLIESGLTFAERVPETHPTIRLVQVRNLPLYRALYQGAKALAWVLPALCALLLALGVLLARDRRRALLWSGLGLAAGMALLAVLAGWGRSAFVDAAGAQGLDGVAAAGLFDALTPALWTGLVAVGAAGLLLALGAALIRRS